MVRGVDNCRRRLRKRAHFRSLFCTGSVIIGIIFIVYRAYTFASSREEKEYNILLDKLKKVKGIGKSSLLYVDKSEYIFADEQPDTSDIRNILAKQPYYIKANTTRLSDEKPGERNKTKPSKSAGDIYNEENAFATMRDASIDDNAVPESFKWHINIPRTTTCTQEEPAKYVVLLRSHRTGSHTVGNIFYRYGDFNNLFFALPKAADFQQYWPLRFHHTRVDKSLLGKDSPNFLINTARNSRIKLKSFLSSETYKVGIMRDPVFHFQSVYESIDMPYLMKMVTNSSDHFKQFVSNPKKTLENITNATNLFDPAFYLLHNGQLFDLGYNVDEYTNTIDMQFVIHELDEYLDLVLITEYMDESLVLLQRMLCWQLSDVAYLKKRVRRNRFDMTEEDKRDIREWNHHDSMLYNHFNKSLWERISQQDDSFWRDVKRLKEMNAHVLKQCVNDTTGLQKGNKNSRGSEDNIPLGITYTKLNATRKQKMKSKRFLLENFELFQSMKESIDPYVQHICERLLLTEREYIQFLKIKQKAVLQQKDIVSKTLFRNTTEGQFYYEFINSVVSNETKTEMPELLEEKPNEEVIETSMLGMSHTD